MVSTYIINKSIIPNVCMYLLYLSYLNYICLKSVEIELRLFDKQIVPFIVVN